MEPTVGTAARSGDAMLESVGFGEELYRLMEAPQESASSFTALLELPPTQAMKLIHSPESSPALIAGEFVPRLDHPEPYFRPIAGNLTFPSNTTLIQRAAKFSVFTGGNNSPDTSSVPSNSTASLDKVKNEPMETDANDNSLPEQLVSEAEDKGHRAAKRKERERKGKGSTKKCKNESSEESDKLPYVHVRARRGQATDSHSLAERARREKINARMKLLQELVPGCDKISGTALVLDEIINHVQSLQHQVEFLSMRLAAVNPRVDVNLDSILAAESGSLMGNNFPGMVMPLMWPQVQANGHRQQYQQQWHLDAVQQPVWGREEDNHNLVTPESSLLSNDSSANSVFEHLNLLKMEQ